ncbi:phosphomethylpyrimidine synthase ThiC, partial [bacterium]|nr:phosphomethylpyrimidine synthase ThiC [bacterium]
MLTMEEARQGKATEALAAVAGDENIAVEKLVALVASGKAAILKNNRSTRRPVGLGPGLRTKVNANLGTSSDASSLDEELEKVDAAIAAGADAIMDLSTGGDLDTIRRAVLERSTVPVGSVPLYQAAVRARTQGVGMVHMTADDML